MQGAIEMARNATKAGVPSKSDLPAGYRRRGGLVLGTKARAARVDQSECKRAAMYALMEAHPESAEELLARVAQATERAAHGGDPLNIAKRKLKNAPQEAQRMSAIRKAIKAKERVVGDGSIVSGTGLTVGKLRETTIARLISTGRIGSIELQALTDIERVYTHLCTRLMVRGYEIGERASKSATGNDPSWFIDAYNQRYKPWADDWSRRRVQLSDKTLEVVFDVMMSNRTGKEIDAEHGWRHGQAIKVFINGLRDYAAAAGWVGGAMKVRWQGEARAVFAKRKVRIKAAYLLAKATKAARIA